MIQPEALLELCCGIRDATASDRPRIYSDWQKSQKDAEPYRHMREGQFMREMTLRIRRLLDKADAKVACNIEFPDQIYGWAVGETRGLTPVVHYVYVKAVYRRKGIARLLLQALAPDGACEFTHWPERPALLERFAGAHFNPFRAESL